MGLGQPEVSTHTVRLLYHLPFKGLQVSAFARRRHAAIHRTKPKRREARIAMVGGSQRDTVFTKISEAGIDLRNARGAVEVMSIGRNPGSDHRRY
jgi:hypothetical protein